MAIAPQIPLEDIEKQLDARSRGPFRRVLAKLLANAPSEEAISKQAEAHPDRWGQTTAMIARLSGYTEKLELEGSIDLHIQSLSDSALERLVMDLQRQLDTQSSGTTLEPHKDQLLMGG